MSYGHASKRDERRKVAIANLEKQIQKYKTNSELKAKLALAEKVLENTKANLGKGSSALTKKSLPELTPAEVVSE